MATHQYRCYSEGRSSSRSPAIEPPSKPYTIGSMASSLPDDLQYSPATSLEDSQQDFGGAMASQPGMSVPLTEHMYYLSPPQQRAAQIIEASPQATIQAEGQPLLQEYVHPPIEPWLQQYPEVWNQNTNEYRQTLYDQYPQRAPAQTPQEVHLSRRKTCFDAMDMVRRFLQQQNRNRLLMTDEELDQNIKVAQDNLNGWHWLLSKATLEEQSHGNAYYSVFTTYQAEKLSGVDVSLIETRMLDINHRFEEVKKQGQLIMQSIAWAQTWVDYYRDEQNHRFAYTTLEKCYSELGQMGGSYF